MKRAAYPGQLGIKPKNPAWLCTGMKAITGFMASRAAEVRNILEP